MPAFLGKLFRDRHKLTPSVSEAMSKDGLKLGAGVARERIAHLDRRVQILGALAEHIGQVLTGVLPAGKVQGNRVLLHLGQDVRREGPLAFGSHFGCGGTAGPPQVQDPHGSIIIVNQGRIGGLGEERITDRHRLLEKRLHHLPLGRLRHRNAEALLKLGQPVVRHPAAVTQQRDRRSCARSILLLTGLCGRRGGEHLPAGVATQTLQLVSGCRDRRRAFDAQDDRRGGLRPQSAFGAARTLISRLQVGMGYLHPMGSGVVAGLDPPVSLGFGLGNFDANRRGARGTHPVGLLGLGSEE